SSAWSRTAPASWCILPAGGGSAPISSSGAAGAGPAGARRSRPRSRRSISGISSGAGRPTQPGPTPRAGGGFFPLSRSSLRAEQQQIIGYPIAGLNNDLRFGHRRYNFIWYRVGDAQTLREMCVDENGQQHEYSVPPPLIRKDLIVQMRAEAEAIMPPQFLDCL